MYGSIKLYAARTCCIKSARQILDRLAIALEHQQGVWSAASGARPWSRGTLVKTCDAPVTLYVTLYVTLTLVAPEFRNYRTHTVENLVSQALLCSAPRFGSMTSVVDSEFDAQQFRIQRVPRANGRVVWARLDDDMDQAAVL